MIAVGRSDATRRGSPAALAAIVLAALAASSCRPVRGNRTNVLLVTIETTRADHLSAYGYPRDTSPSLARLASEGVTFEHHSTVSPRTNPSLASLMTSSYPQDHGVRNLLLPLEPENRTLAEVLRDAGYATAAVQTHPRLIRASGFAQGFQAFDDDYRAHPLAAQACDAAAKWIRGASGSRRPWFLWLHLMDPHWTYEPPSPWDTRYGPHDPRPGELYDALRSRRATIGPVIFRNTMPRDEIDAFVALYDGEIRYTDEAIGRLLAGLEASGAAPRTLVIVTADHGESLGEHGYFFEHGDFGSEPEIHIPLLMRLPGVLPPGAKVLASERSIDVAPTILDLAGLPPEPAFRGESLRPYVSGGATDDRACFGEIDENFYPENTRREVQGVHGKWRWVRSGRFKLFYIPRLSGHPDWVLYDLEEDPGETSDAGARFPSIRDELRKRLEAWIAQDVRPERDYHISPETREQLRSLGYLN